MVITKDDTLFLKGKGEQKDIERRCDTIRDQMESSTSDYEKEKMQERIAKMASGISDLPSYCTVDFGYKATHCQKNFTCKLKSV